MFTSLINLTIDVALDVTLNVSAIGELLGFHKRDDAAVLGAIEAAKEEILTGIRNAVMAGIDEQERRAALNGFVALKRDYANILEELSRDDLSIEARLRTATRIADNAQVRANDVVTLFDKLGVQYIDSYALAASMLLHINGLRGEKLYVDVADLSTRGHALLDRCRSAKRDSLTKEIVVFVGSGGGNDSSYLGHTWLELRHNGALIKKSRLFTGGEPGGYQPFEAARGQFLAEADALRAAEFENWPYPAVFLGYLKKWHTLLEPSVVEARGAILQLR